MFCSGKHFSFSRYCPEAKRPPKENLIEQAKMQNLCLKCLNAACKGKRCDPEKRFLCSGCGFNLQVCECNSNPPQGKVKVNTASLGASLPSFLGKTAMLTERVFLIGKDGKTHPVNIMHDPGYTDTVFSLDIACYGKQISEIFDVKVGGYSNDFSHHLKKVPIMEFKLLSKNGPVTFQGMGVKKLEGISPSKILVPTIWKDRFNKDVLFRSGELHVLVGGDNAHLFPAELERRTVGKETMILYKSKLSNNHMIYGRSTINMEFKSDNPSLNKVNINTQMRKTKLNKLEEQYLQLYSLENFDLEDNKKEAFEIKKKGEEAEMLRNMKYSEKDQIWQTEFIYSEKLKSLENNYKKTKARMCNLNKKLYKLPNDIKNAVNLEIKKNVDSGLWRKIDSSHHNLKKHYLPMMYVLQPSSKSTPVRLVLDPSCTDQNGLSLNSVQHSGFSNIGDLRGNLLRFRTAQNVAVGDLQKFFHSFALLPPDQSLRRLLLPKEGLGITEEPTFEEYAVTKVQFGDRSSPVLSVLCKKKHTLEFIHTVSENYQEDVSKCLIDNSYVDDSHADAPWKSNIHPLINEINNLVEIGGMKYKEWIHAGDDKEEMKYLGYFWHPKSDSLRLKYQRKNDLSHEKFTKRKVLQEVATLFDPLLLLSPFIVKFRLFFANVCMVMKDKNWDDELPVHMQDEFKKILEDIQDVSELSVTRSTIPKQVKYKIPTCKAVIFTDGSLEAYSAVMYLRFCVGDQIFSNLLTSAVKIVGSKKITPPRSELLAAELAVNLCLKTVEEVKKNVQIESVTYITDSRVVLAQLRSDPCKFDTFTGPRINFIQDNSKKSTWMWCPGDQNPADLSTRNKTTAYEMKSVFWLNGGFLMQPQDEWPTKCLAEDDILMT